MLELSSLYIMYNKFVLYISFNFITNISLRKLTYTANTQIFFKYSNIRKYVQIYRKYSYVHTYIL